MQESILRDVVSSVAGDRAKMIVDLLFDKKNVNEFLIAKKMKLTINQTRNILYKLADEGLVSFIRKKDSKKGGWYTYFWTLNPNRGLAKYKETLVKNINETLGKINSKKTERFFFSPNCNIEFNEETALTNDYTCPECGELMQLKDNSKEVLALEKELARFNEILVGVDEQIGLLNEKGEQVKQRRLKAEEKKKKEDREERKKQRAKDAKKLAKQSKGSKNTKAPKASKRLRDILGLRKKTK